MLPDFANSMKMCSPPSVGSTFSKNDFCQYRVQDHETGFKITTFWGAFPPCAVQKMIIFADWAENGPPGKLNFTSLSISHAFWSRISRFRDWFCYNLWKTLPVLVAKHSTLGEAITAWHEACVGAISSWSRPAAIADFTLHALFRPSAALCRR